jgi:FkbM family methyltransferase
MFNKLIMKKIDYKSLIYNILLKLFSSIVPQKILNLIESFSQQLQGKGSGTLPMSLEVKSCIKLLKDRPVKVIFDVGANEGDYTIELLKYYKNSNYYLFEPSSLNYEKLKIKFFGLPNVEIINKALSDINDVGLLYADKSGSGLGSLYKRRLEHFDIYLNHEEKIDLIRLDSFFTAERTIDYLKLDVEGSEMKVLIGTGELIKKIKLIQFEIGSQNIDSKTFFQDFWYFFKNNNFDLFRISPAGPKKINKYRENDEHFRMSNYIALNKAK